MDDQAKASSENAEKGNNAGELLSQARKVLDGVREKVGNSADPLAYSIVGDVERVDALLQLAQRPDARLTTLINAMTRMQASYRGQRDGLQLVTAGAGADLVTVVLSDLIRLAAELRAGDGLRGGL